MDGAGSKIGRRYLLALMLCVTASAGCDRCTDPANSDLAETVPAANPSGDTAAVQQPSSPIVAESQRYAVIPANYTEEVESEANTFDLLFANPRPVEAKEQSVRDVDFGVLFAPNLSKNAAPLNPAATAENTPAAENTASMEQNTASATASLAPISAESTAPAINFNQLFANRQTNLDDTQDIASGHVTPAIPEQYVIPEPPKLSVNFESLLERRPLKIESATAEANRITSLERGSRELASLNRRNTTSVDSESVSAPLSIPVSPSVRASFDSQLARLSANTLGPRQPLTKTPRFASSPTPTAVPVVPAPVTHAPVTHAPAPAVAAPTIAEPTRNNSRIANNTEDKFRTVANPFLVTTSKLPAAVEPTKTIYSTFYNMSSPLDLGSLQQPLLGGHGATQLTLFEAIQVAIASSPQIASLRTDTAVSVAEIDRQSATYDWASFVQTNWDDSSEPVGNDNLGAVNRLNDRKWSGVAGLKRRNLLGGDIELGQEVAFQDTDSVFFNPTDQATSFVSVQYNQPLLRGGGRAFNRSIIDLAVTDARATRAGVVAAVQDILLDTTNAYWALAEARGRLIVLRRSYERARGVATVVTNRTNLDVGPLQKTRADATVAARRSALVGARNDVVLAQEQLLQLILGSEFTSHVNQEVMTTTDVFGPVYNIDIESEVQTALANRQEIHESIELIRRSSIEKGVALNQLLPLLSMTLQVSNRGLRGDYQINSAFSDQWSQGSPTYGVGLEYELPIGNRAANASLKQAKFRVLKFQKDFESVTSEIALDARIAAHNAVTRGRARGARQEALRLAANELTMVIRRLELLIDGDSVGQLYLEDLLQTQAKLEQAEDAFVSACTDYALSQFELERARGTLLTETDLSIAQPNF